MRLTCGGARLLVPGSTQAFYKWQADPICQRDLDDAYLTNDIIDIHGDDPEFGYRFIADELERERIADRVPDGADPEVIDSGGVLEEPEHRPFGGWIRQLEQPVLT